MAFRLLPNNLKQWKVVIIAFAVAATFWFFNSLNKDYTTSLSYPVSFAYNQDSLISVRTLPSNIDLDVTGGGWSLLRKEPLFNPTPLTIDLENPVGVNYLTWLEKLPIIREQMGDVSVIQVIQDTLRIQIEPILKKKVKIWIDSMKIKLADNFRLVSSITCPNDSITLIGPKSFIDTLESDFELQLLEGAIDENYDDDVLVVVPRPGLIRSDPAFVQAIFEVDQFNDLQIEVPVEVLNFPEDSTHRLAEEKVTVHFTVQRSLQQEYVASDFAVSADFNILRKRDSTVLAMLLYFPQDVVDIEIVPSEIRVVPNE
ncbi:MAG: hypothetical protein GY816_21915 [Cytophagales bacterium]|nr:hypothetical protein [Cytophagales bacterium]